MTTILKSDNMMFSSSTHSDKMMFSNSTHFIMCSLCFVRDSISCNLLCQASQCNCLCMSERYSFNCFFSLINFLCLQIQFFFSLKNSFIYYFYWRNCFICCSYPIRNIPVAWLPVCLGQQAFFGFSLSIFRFYFKHLSVFCTFIPSHFFVHKTTEMTKQDLHMFFR